MTAIRATWMRGGTSKCWVFRHEDLQLPGWSVDELLLGLYGSPDPRQVDGVGGGTSTTSKAVILAPSTSPDHDVDYTFAQVGIEEAKVDWGSNCGNCSAVVAPFAIHAGWVPTTDGTTTVRVLNTNTGQTIIQTVPTPGGELLDEPTTSIPGVPGLGAPVRMGFENPAGLSTGTLLPTGAPSDVLQTPAGRFRVSMVDAGAPVVMVDATDLGADPGTPPHHLDLLPRLTDLDGIRRAAAVAMGLAETAETAARAIPKMAVVGASDDPEADIGIQMLSMGRPHPAVPITGSVALTLAARTPGTVVHDRLSRQLGAGSQPAGLGLLTPAGIVRTFVEQVGEDTVVGAVRTYRRLSEGVVFPSRPTSRHTPTPSESEAQQ